MGIAPTIWGPDLWAFIHLSCLGAPSPLDAESKKHYAAFFESLPPVLPCETCSNHLREHLQVMGYDEKVQTTEDLFAWSVELHNRVNVSTGKREWSVEEARSHWMRIITAKKHHSQSGSGDAGKNKRMMLLILLVIIAVIGIITYTVRRYRKKVSHVPQRRRR
jgi:hypothetical protein